MALSATTNYKMFIAMAIVLGLEAWQGKLATKRLLPALFGFSLLLIGLMAMGLAVGRPWYGLPAALLAVGARAANPDSAGQSAQDFAFYLRYFASFDNVLMLLGLAFGIILALKARLEKSHPACLVLGFGLACLLLFTFLPKAPRALYMALPAFALAFMWGCSKGPRLLKVLLPPIFMGISLLQSAFWFYPFSTQALRTTADYVNAHPQPTLSPYSPRIYPYLLRGSQSLLLPSLACPLPTLRQDTLLLLDPYAQIVSNCLQSPSNQLPKFEATDDSYDSPILWLEHAEYRGWTFAQVLQKREARKEQKFIQVY